MNRRISALFLALLCAGAAPCGAQAIDSPATLEALTAEIEAATGTRRWADAILLGQKALAIEEATKGLNDPEVGGTLMLIAGWMRQLDRNADAEPLLRRSLQIFEQNYGKANRFSISASKNLAATLEALGRLDDANSLYTRTLDTMVQRYGPSHRLTAISTNRGRIITPLKDRFGSQIRTHYPLDADTEVTIMRQEARPATVGDVTVTVPAYLERVVATFSQLARSSNQVNQRSGVSVRLSVSNVEVLGANALRRGLRAAEKVVVPRVSDLGALAASTSGKVEIESLEEGREGVILENLVKASVLTVFKELVPLDQVRDVVAAFEEGAIAHTGEDVPSVDLAALVQQVPALRAAVLSLTGGDESPAAVAAAVEFVLEGLHLSKRLNKDGASSGSGATYRGRG